MSNRKPRPFIRPWRTKPCRRTNTWWIRPTSTPKCSSSAGSSSVLSLVGPGRPDISWQARTEGAYHRYCFAIDWEQRQVRDCRNCPARSLCTRAKDQPRRLRIQLRAQYEALHAARQLLTTEAGRKLYKARAGVEGTISQGVRSVGLRQSRYWGLAKTQLQHLATAAAINLDRLGAWFEERPLAQTRVSP